MFDRIFAFLVVRVLQSYPKNWTLFLSADLRNYDLLIFGLVACGAPDFHLHYQLVVGG